MPHIEHPVPEARPAAGRRRLRDIIRALSAGDLRGTNPTNAAERHNAVMLEAWKLSHAAAGQGPEVLKAAASTREQPERRDRPPAR